jgi:hypothetical protein
MSSKNWGNEANPPRAKNDLMREYTQVIDVKQAKTLGFQDGFAGKAGRAVSDGYDEQTAYLTAFTEGRDHRKLVDKVCADEGIDVNELVRKAVEFYVKKFHAADVPMEDHGVTVGE